MNTFWKEDWDQARERLTAWWEHRGLALCVTSPKDKPWEDLPDPKAPTDVREAYLDAAFRVRSAAHAMAHTFFGAEAFPYYDAYLGAGSLGSMLGSEPHFTAETVWYEPCIRNPEAHPPLRFDPQDIWFRRHMALIEEGLRFADGRFLPGIPDLIENIDTLAQLRDPQTLMLDLIERPEWVKQRVAEINQAYFAVFDAMYAKVRDRWGGNAFCAFRVWGPGKTAKLQCDASAMFSPAMFDEFVVPALSAQCTWLDYSLYHLDGTHAVCHLDHLLAIPDLDAIEWTPQAGIEGGGHPRWYDLYRRILKGGKGVQAMGVAEEEVLPLIDAVGADGLFIVCRAKDETSARRLIDKVEKLR